MTLLFSQDTTTSYATLKKKDKETRQQASSLIQHDSYQNHQQNQSQNTHC